MKSIGKVENISREELQDLWEMNRGTFYNVSSYAGLIAERAVREIESNVNADAYIMLDDETGEIVSICAYESMGVSQVLDFFSGMACDSTIKRLQGETGEISYKNFILIYDIAGKGRNAAYSTMKDIMQIGKMEGRAVILQAMSNATGFYEKLGFFYLQRYNECGKSEIIMIWEP